MAVPMIVAALSLVLLLFVLICLRLPSGDEG